MPAYYNELDAFAAQWLRNLIAAGHIAAGEVDERSIVEVQPDDLRVFTQCHFFAGIGGWSHALRLAGFDDARPVWSGSCPCQPFSAAGKGEGARDERHLWPHFFRLIRECRPVAVFGEQVASRDALAWLDHVSTDLEGEGYAVGAVDTCAAGFGAPHIRQRLYWVADADGGNARAEREQRGREQRLLAQGGSPFGLADDDQAGRGIGRAAHDDDRRDAFRHDIDGRGADGDMGNAVEPGSQGFQRSGDVELQGGSGAHGSTATAGFWRDAEWIACRDGKARPTEPGAFPLAHGIPARVGRLRGYGNAIVAPQAAEFVRAFLEVRP